MHPVVSFIEAPFYKLAKYLHTWFKQTIGFYHPIIAQNSIELSELLCRTPPPSGSILVSFDVAGLYPNVPLKPTGVVK